MKTYTFSEQQMNCVADRIEDAAFRRLALDGIKQTVKCALWWVGIGAAALFAVSQ